MLKSPGDIPKIYHHIVQNLPNTSIVIFDRDMRYTLAEGSIIKRVLNVENSVGKLPHEVLSINSLNFLLPIYQRILMGEDFSFERNTPDYAYQSYASPVKDESGQIIGGMILTHEVTKAKRTEAELRVSEARFHSLVDLAPVGIIQTDANGKRVFCNTRWCKMTGLTLEQAFSGDSYQTIHSDDRDVAGAAWRSMMETHLPFENAVFRYQRPDGKTVWVSGNGRPLYDEYGVVNGYLGIVTNIDDQVRTQAALRDSESRYRSFVNAMSEGVVLQDQNGEITTWNPAAEHILGLSTDQMMGLTPPDPRWRIVHEDGSPFPGEFHSALVTLHTGEPLSNIIIGIHKPDQSFCWVSVNSRPIFADNIALPVAVVISFVDITEIRNAQDKLRQERDLLRTLINNMPDYIFLKDTEGRFILSNDAHTHASGIPTSQDIVGKTAFDVFSPELASQFHTDDQALIESGESLISAERETIDSEGNQKTVLTTKIPWRDSNGEILGLVGISRDITERKRFENMLFENEQRLRLITDNVHDIITQTDAEHYMIYASESCQSLLGYEPYELLGKYPSDFIHPDDQLGMVSKLQASEEAGLQYVTFEARVRHNDGHYLMMESAVKFVFDEQSNNSGAVFIIRDITERKHMENALRKNEERLRLITDNIQDLITQNDVRGKLVFVSPSAQRMLGYEPASLLGSSSAELIHPDDRLLLTERLKTAIESHQSHFTVECRLRHLDGYYIWIEATVNFIMDEQSNFSGGVFVARDITERKLLQTLTLEQEKLQMALEKELELSTLKTRMMQRIAHEFRTPLTVIQTSSETLIHYLDRLTPEQRIKRGDMIRRKILSITDMLDQIGLVINGNFKPEALYRASIDISALCCQVAAELETQLSLPGKFALELPQKAIIPADEQVLKSALLHIMRNAMRYSEASSVVTVNLIQLKNGIELRVTDTGIGILPQEQPRIFEPFFRGSNIDEVGGLGIGLTIACAAIEAHDGTVTIESVPQQGTTVIIRIR